MASSNNKHSRAIAAPFQQPKVGKSNTSDQHQHDTRKPQSPKASSRSGVIDFRSFMFKPLQPYHELSHSGYCGPTTESNWVIPGVLLVGAYPATQDDDETFELLTSILKLGVKKFVCLQQEYRPGVPEDMWRSGLALRPYYEDVKKIVEHKSIIPEFNGHSIVDLPHLSFVHCPIVDCDITDDSTVLNLCKQLVVDISKGEVIYLHCWGGHGRTGTVVSIMLHLMYGLTASEAMRRCQIVHDLRKCPVDVGSPQTQTQRDQVTRIVTQLMNSYKIDRKPLQSKKLMNDSFNPTTIEPSDSSKKVQRAAKIRSSFTASFEHSETTIITSTKLPKFSDQKSLVVQSLSNQSENVYDPTSSSKHNSSKPISKSSFSTQNHPVKVSSPPLTSIVKERTAITVQPLLPKGRVQNSDMGGNCNSNSDHDANRPIVSVSEVGSNNPQQAPVNYKVKSPEKKSPFKGSMFSPTHSPKAAEQSELHIDGHGMIGNEFGTIATDGVQYDNQIPRFTSHDHVDVTKGRPMSISLEPDEDISTQTQQTGMKEDEVLVGTAVPTSASAKKSQQSPHHENSVRNALMVARQVLLGSGGGASANSAVIVGDTLPIDGKKKMVPIPPPNSAPAGKVAGVATTRKVEKEYLSIM